MSFEEIWNNTSFFILFFVWFSVIGNCLFAYGRKLGELCRRDADCESGLVMMNLWTELNFWIYWENNLTFPWINQISQVCDVSAAGGASVCRAPMVIARQYAEDCASSSDCDITRWELIETELIDD